MKDPRKPGNSPEIVTYSELLEKIKYLEYDIKELQGTIELQLDFIRKLEGKDESIS